MAREFEFAFEGRYRRPALAFGIRPATARVLVTDDELVVRFEHWRLRTALATLQTGILRHSAATLTVADPEALAAALKR